MHRLTTDRKVFQSRKTVAGGSMMIDCSGSMGFSREDIVEIINLLPASWIAGYVGYNSTKYDVNGDHMMEKFVSLQTKVVWTQSLR